MRYFIYLFILEFKETHACIIVSSESSSLPSDLCVHGSTELYLFRCWASLSCAWYALPRAFDRAFRVSPFFSDNSVPYLLCVVAQLRQERAQHLWSFEPDASRTSDLRTVLSRQLVVSRRCSLRVCTRLTAMRPIFVVSPLC